MKIKTLFKYPYHYGHLMTKTKIMSVFAIVAVAAMMGAAVIAPAYAGGTDPPKPGAQKVAFQDRQGGLDITGFCIANLDANGDIHVNMHVKGFDKGDDVKFGFISPVFGIQTSATASGGGLATSGEITIFGPFESGDTTVVCRVGLQGHQEASATIYL